MFYNWPIAALTSGAGGEPQARRTSHLVKCLVPAQGDGTRPNEVSAAIPGDAVARNKLLAKRILNTIFALPQPAPNSELTVNTQISLRLMKN
jgi:hypothetical protein